LRHGPEECLIISVPRCCTWCLRLFLAAAPLLAGCHLFPAFPNPQQDKSDKEVLAGTPSKHTMRVSQFVFQSDFELQRDLPIFKELGVLREQVYRELRLPPSSTEVLVYLFQDKDRYEKYMDAKQPGLPKRRAFFIAQPRRLGGTEDLMVFTYWGPRIQQDLRHELTHAVLHSVLKDVPLWLDEGLAEYYEVPPSWNGANPQHVEELRQASVKFDLNRLEKLKDVQQMTPLEYREAWAWVHLMLRSTPQAKQVLVQYLQELRTNPNPGLLRPRLATAFLALENALQTHLADLDRKLPRSPTAQR
jgi:hypothetical protein